MFHDEDVAFKSFHVESRAFAVNSNEINNKETSDVVVTKAGISGEVQAESKLSAPVTAPDHMEEVNEANQPLLAPTTRSFSSIKIWPLIFHIRRDITVSRYGLDMCCQSTADVSEQHNRKY